MRRSFLVAVALAALAALSLGQITTGSISGRVEDPGGLAVPEASVTAVHVATGRTRTTTTGVSGDFTLAGLDPGEYRLVVKKAGFKQVERTDLVLPAGMHVPAGTLTLQIGQLAESVTVTAERGAIVQTVSAERSDVITGSQLENLQILGRNVPSLVGLLPGVVMISEAAGLDRGTTFSALGNRRTQNQITVDGLPGTDHGNNFEFKLQQSVDSVAEVRILLSNYQAEYGNAAGATVEMVIKSGTRQFHGLGSYFKRHEQFNANDFFNNRLGIPKPRYRYNTWTYNIGGPVTIPKWFNRNREKMFFFWSQEFWPRRDSGVSTFTVPTELERRGDFSQTVDVNNRLVVIRDPFNNNQPFAGNIIPAARVDPNGAALLNFFVKPNFFDRNISGGNYNYVWSTETNSPKSAHTLKVDYNFTPKDIVYVTFAAYSEKNEGFTRMPGWNESWPQYFRVFKAGNKGLATRYTKVLSPTVSNEFHFGWFTNPETMKSPEEELKRNSREAVGFKGGQFYPQNNKHNLIPNASFGGVPGAAELNINGRFPIDDPYHSLTWTDKLSIVRGPHSLKFGVLYYWYMLGRGPNATQFGAFNFGRNVNNPLDTNWAYSNAALGVFNTYTESSAIPYFNVRSSRAEWFAQDNWRVTKRLTLDLGIRFSRFVPIHDRDNRVSAFFLDRYDRTKAPMLIAPGRSGNQRVGVHPVTGQTYPEALIGAIAPGVGDPFTGMVLGGTDPNLPKYFLKNRGWHWGPRIGFAFDPFGDGKTSIRGGFGMFYEQVAQNQWSGLVNQPPLVQTPQIYYGRIATLLSSAGFLFPTNATSVDPEGHVPTTLNFSLSVQRNVGFGTVVDIGYAGNVGRHLLWSRALNAVPYGTHFRPEAIDPTTNRPYPAAFLRPVIGWNNITELEHASSSNYHSLQVSANRRFQRGFQFGFAWTWSKTMNYGDEDGNGVSPFIPVRVWNYGLASYDRTHTVRINWIYDIPAPKWKSSLARAALRGWQLTGITTFQSGAPVGVGYSTTTAIDITGSPTEGARVVVTGNPVLPKSERTFDRFFRTEVFKLPAVGTWGNAARTQFRGPGINNWDISAIKNFPIWEKMRLQYRCEAYNAFNHTQFSAVNATARFDAQGNQVNTLFGQMSAARSARIVQMALRFVF